jgi:hypothetical protein
MGLVLKVIGGILLCACLIVSNGVPFCTIDSMGPSPLIIAIIVPFFMINEIISLS